MSSINIFIIIFVFSNIPLLIKSSPKRKSNLVDSRQLILNSNEAKILFYVNNEFNLFKVNESLFKPIDNQTPINIFINNNTTSKDNTMFGRGLNYNIKGNYIIWSNTTAIYGSPLNKKLRNALNINSRTLLFNTTEVFRLSLDWIHNLLYYIDSGEIYVTNVNNVQQRVLLQNEDMDQFYATDIAVNPIESFVVWIQWNRKTFEFRIVRADQDLSNKKVLVDRGFYGYDPYILFQPCCLTIDYNTRQIYYIDNKFQTLESILFDGSKREKHFQSSLFQLTHSLDLYDNYVFWANDQHKTIFSLNKDVVNSKINTVLRVANDIESIRVIHASRQPNTDNRCSNSRCSQLCLPAGDDQYKCVCTFGQNKNATNVCYESHNSLIKMANSQLFKKESRSKPAKVMTVTITESLTKPYPMYVFKCQSINDKRVNQSIKMDWYDDDNVKLSQKYKNSVIAKNMTTNGNSIELKVSYPFVKQLKKFSCRTSLTNNYKSNATSVHGIYKVVVRQLPKAPKILSHSFSFAGIGAKVYLTLQVENLKVDPPLDKYRLVYKGLIQDTYFQQEYSVDFEPISSESNNLIYVIPFDIDYISANVMAFKLYAHNEVGWSHAIS